MCNTKNTSAIILPSRKCFFMKNNTVLLSKNASTQTSTWLSTCRIYDNSSHLWRFSIQVAGSSCWWLKSGQPVDMVKICKTSHWSTGFYTSLVEITYGKDPMWNIHPWLVAWDFLSINRLSFPEAVWWSKMVTSKLYVPIACLNLKAVQLPRLGHFHSALLIRRPHSKGKSTNV